MSVLVGSTMVKLDLGFANIFVVNAVCAVCVCVCCSTEMSVQNVFKNFIGSSLIGI